MDSIYQRRRPDWCVRSQSHRTIRLLIKLTQLVVKTESYKREILEKDIFINPDFIVSLVEHNKVLDYLKMENIDTNQESFSLIRYASGSKIEEMIVFGSTVEIMSTINKKGKGLLNG